MIDGGGRRSGRPRRSPSCNHPSTSATHQIEEGVKAELLDISEKLEEASVADDLRGTSAAGGTRVRVLRQFPGEEEERDEQGEVKRRREEWGRPSGSYPSAGAASRKWDGTSLSTAFWPRRKKKRKNNRFFAENPLGFSVITKFFKTRTLVIYLEHLRSSKSSEKN